MCRDFLSFTIYDLIAPLGTSILVDEPHQRAKGVSLMFRPIRMLILLGAILGLFPDGSTAGGILHVSSPTIEGRTIAVERPGILHSRTLVTVSESSIEYRTDQTFFNNNELPLEGLFLMPLEPGTVSLEMDVRVNGVSIPYSVVSAYDFFPVLIELTTATNDPSLLGLAGKDVLVVRPINIEARRQKSIRVQFKRSISIDQDQLDLVVPLDGERYSLGPVAGFEIRVRFKMSRPLRTVLSPSHHASIFREAPHRCLVVVRSEEKRIRDDFRLLVTFSGQEMDLRLFTHRPTNRKGAFMAFISPPLPDPTQKESYKDVVFIIDRSGSMGALDLELAEHAVILGLERMRPLDRFNILTMGTNTERMRNELIPVTEENIMEAVRFVNSAPKGGGTDLYNSLLIALEQFSSRKRPAVIVVAGDGRSTIGITSLGTIIEHVKRFNKVGARIFTIALGDFADTTAMEKIAESARGSSIHFSGKEDFNAVINRFYEGISPPQVSDILLDFLDIWPEEVIPEPISDVTGPDSVVVFGRYDNKSDVSSRVRLRGKIKGQVKSITKTFEFPLTDTARPYISAIWAMRKISKLLERQRIKGIEPETSDQIRALAEEFGFRVGSLAPSATQDTGRLYWSLKTSFVPADVESDRFRRVGGKIFRRESAGWVDTLYRASMIPKTVGFLSTDYFSILKEEPRIGPYLAIGPEVTLVLYEGPIKIIAEEP